MHALLLLALAYGPEVSSPPLAYVVPEPGEPMRAPRGRALSLSDRVPDDVTLGFDADGAHVRVGQHLYGDPGTTRVAFALASDAITNDVRLYVDLDRDRTISAEELVPQSEAAGSRLRWETPLDVLLTAPDAGTKPVARRVMFELGETGTIFGIATMGYLEGQIEVDGALVRVRRRDADANGCFGDTADHLWIDRDANGTWAPLRELYVTQPILEFALEGTSPSRYAVRSSRRGNDLRLTKIEGTGTAKLAIPSLTGKGSRTDIAEAFVVLAGRDGSSVRVDANPHGVELPVGDYRITSLSLRLKATDEGQVWSYLFSSAFEPTEDDWTQVAKNATWEFDPVGTLDFQVNVAEDEAMPGENVIVQPYLYTGDRLLVRHVYRGWDAPSYSFHGGAKVELAEDDGTLLGEANSGFA